MPKNLIARNRNILLRGHEHIDSVPYSVTLRWVFYRLYQDGLYTSKDEYSHFKGVSSRARHSCLYGWHPESVVDDTRHLYFYGVGSGDEWGAIDSIECNLDKFLNQDLILMILFEAKAMFSQFSHYTRHIPLVPLGGDPSIPFKYYISKTIEKLSFRYRKPVRLLYFGDYDDKGQQIYTSAISHIRKWCDVNFDVDYCGLTKNHVVDYNLPLSVKGRGYQWEALNDSQASYIITSNVSKYQDLDAIEPIVEKESVILKKWKKLLHDSMVNGGLV